MSEKEVVGRKRGRTSDEELDSPNKKLKKGKEPDDQKQVNGEHSETSDNDLPEGDAQLDAEESDSSYIDSDEDFAGDSNDDSDYESDD